MGRQLNGRELAKQVKERGARPVCRALESLYQKRQIDPTDFSIRDLFINLVEDGREVLDMMDARRKGGYQDGAQFREAAQAVNTADFSSITGQIVYSAIREAFDDQILLANDLVRPMRTVFLAGEKVPGIGRIGDHVEAISEGQPYPALGVNEEYVVAPPPEKRGFRIDVTRELVVADRTGILMERVSEGGNWLAINKEKRVLDIVLGINNNYKRNGTATNTYLTSGAYINDQTGNALASGSWLAIEKAELLFDSILDPNTNEPIMLVGDTLIVPTALKRTAHRIVHATQIRFGDGSSSTTAAFGPNPLDLTDNSGGRFRLNAGGLKILSSAYIKSRSSSSTKWWYGAPQKAFRYSEVWGIETMQAPDSYYMNFDRDIVNSFKVSEFGVPWVYEPRYMTRNDS